MRQFQQTRQIQTTIIRPGVIIFGPHDLTTLVHLAPMLKNRFFPLVGDGRQWICYSYVENLVIGMIQAAACDAAQGQTLILTDDRKITLRDHLQALSQVLGYHPTFVPVPKPAAAAVGWVLESLWKMGHRSDPPPIHRYRVRLATNDFHFRCDRAKQLLGYLPQIDYQVSLERTADWYLGWLASQDRR